jgi:hypothetical protein
MARAGIQRISRLELALAVHAQLCKLVAPATPESLRSSSFSNNPTLRILCYAAFIGYALLFTSNFLGAAASDVRVLGAAVAGSAFYSLYAASQYLIQKTFSPSYNQVYLIRLTLGVLSGLILGTFGTRMLNLQGTTADFGQGVLALVGGWSADAVAQILQRIADTLVTIVRGSDKARSDAETKQQVMATQTSLAAKVQEAINTPNAADARKKLDAIVSDLLKK